MVSVQKLEHYLFLNGKVDAKFSPAFLFRLSVIHLQQLYYRQTRLLLTPTNYRSIFHQFSDTYTQTQQRQQEERKKKKKPKKTK